VRERLPEPSLDMKKFFGKHRQHRDHTAPAASRSTPSSTAPDASTSLTGMGPTLPDAAAAAKPVRFMPGLGGGSRGTNGSIHGSSEKEDQMATDKPQGDNTHATTLARGSQITGNLTFEGTVVIEGQVDGEIAANECVVVGETALVKATLIADTIVINGTVHGDINARRRVEIRAPGKLYGNITTPSLIIHDGVLFEGHCSMGGDAKRAEKKPPLLPLPKAKNGAPPNGNLKVEGEGDWG
jgi:cytoskeletal protein CcmA (bactofilin family)